MQSVKLLEDYQLFMYLFILWYPCRSIRRQCVCKPLKQYKVSAYQCLIISLCYSLVFLSPLSAASSFSFCRASLEHTVSAEELSYQLPRRAGGSNLTWHDGRSQKTAHTRTVKLLQQPGTEGIQVSGHPRKQNRGNVEKCCHRMQQLRIGQVGP